MTYNLFSQHLSPPAQLRLLLLTMLLLWTTLTVGNEGAATPLAENGASVFTEPPAYLHPPEAIGFDLSGIPSAPTGGVEADLVASAHDVPDLEARAHMHMSLAVYYKLHGQRARAEAERRKADYWMRVAKFAE